MIMGVDWMVAISYKGVLMEQKRRKLGIGAREKVQAKQSQQTL